MIWRLVLAGILACGVPADASAVLFKCGNSYQDRPCDSAADQQLLRPSGRPMAQPVSRTTTAPIGPASSASAPAAAASGPAPVVAGGVRMSCFRAGEHAQLVQWKREGGASRDAQLAEVKSRRDALDAAAVIRQVYERKGSAAEIRKAIETECAQNGGVQQSPPGQAAAR